MILLKVTYRVRVHHTSRFEPIFQEHLMPLVRRHRLSLVGFWRTVVGEVGEYLELWEFESIADFELRWGALMQDPDLQKILKITGPWVEDEKFALLEPVPTEKPAFETDSAPTGSGA